MSRAGQNGRQPRAMVHKRILDVAESQPEASLEAIASEVSAASPELVERVLDEYGDPADTEADTAMKNGQQSTADDAEEPAEAIAFDLSDAQRETLEQVRKRPDAPQSEIATELDVTRATVSRRLSAIPGFEWDERDEFLAAYFDEGEVPVTDTAVDDGEASDGEMASDEAATAGDEMASDEAAADDKAAADDGAASDATADDGEASDDGTADTGTAGAAADVGEETAGDGSADAATDTGEEAPETGDPNRLAELEERVADLEEADGEPDAGTASDDSLPTDLAHRTLHAAMDSDRISEDEELELMGHLLDG